MTLRLMALAGVAMTMAGCGDDDKPTSNSASAPRVEAADFRFSPAVTRVKVGTTVEWRNTGQTEHTIKGAGFFSRAVPSDGRFQHSFGRPGTFDYLCTLHPDSMKGTVVVTGPDGAAPPD